MTQEILTSFPQFFFELLAFCGVSRIRIRLTSNGNYSLSPAKGIRLLIYALIHLNSFGKGIYLFLVLFGFFNVQLEFLDQLAIGLWTLIVFYVISIGILFGKKYPFYEVVCALWKVQNNIFVRFGKPEDFRRKCIVEANCRVWYQILVSIVGSAAVAVQYDGAPKYPAFTYYLVDEKYETPFLKFLFGAHETLFILHAWLLYSGVAQYSSICGSELSRMFKLMSNHVQDLSLKKLRDRPNSFASILPKRPETSHAPNYDVEDLLREYQKLFICMTELNTAASYIFLVLHTMVYIQLISDVFVMVQILRAGNVEFMAIFFYLEDCLVAMTIIFLMFNAMSFVAPASEEFINQVQSSLNDGCDEEQVYVRKILNSLQPIAMKIGPSSVGPSTVGNAMMLLLNYYICAAMW